MLKRLNPEGIAPPLSPYSHAVEVPAGARRLYISGQVGIDPEGKLAEGPEGQIEQTFANLLAILDAAGMTVADLVKVTVLLTRAEDIPRFRAIRDRIFAGERPASTLMIVAGLARPEFVVEVEAVAAA